MAGIERCSARHELCDATMEEALMDLTTLWHQTAEIEVRSGYWWLYELEGSMHRAYH
jgi:hypothetical protein